MGKYRNRLALVRHYLNNDTISSVGPPVIGIETTNRCNLKCTMCPRTSKMTRPLGDMDFTVFKKIIDDGKKHLEFVWLQHYGEPLLTKDIFSMISYAKKNKIGVGISTNASFLTEINGEKLITAGLDHIIFAFDGATKETYEKVRVNANYETVRKNILKFLETKKRMRSDIFVVLQCIYMSATEKDIGKFKEMWDLPGVDTIRIRQVTHSIDRQKKEQSKFVNLRRNLPCYWLWKNPHIQWDGTVIPCCQDVNGEEAIGNVKEKQLAEVWNSEKMQELRKMLIEGRYDEVPICKGCNMYQPSLPEVVGSTFFSISQLNKLIPKAETIISSIRYKQ